jgi:hypothetical protein
MTVWWNEEDGHIHLTAEDVAGFHTRVGPDPCSKRGHPNLFSKLAKVLRDHGAAHPVSVDERRLEEADEQPERMAATPRRQGQRNRQARGLAY